MIGRVVLAALLAGVAAGLILAGIQYVRLTPIILAAEVYEGDPTSEVHDHAAASQEPATGQSIEASADNSAAVTEDHAEDSEWAPQDGAERTALTTAASMAAGAGFAALLAGISLLTGVPINRRNGVIWGLCGFLAITLAPAAGLPPELPGMPAGDLAARQVWWFFTIAATGAAIYLFAVRRESWAAVVAIILIALPHLIGAPQPESHTTAVPAGLSASFTANSLAANAVFWMLIGVFLGYALSRGEVMEQAS